MRWHLRQLLPLRYRSRYGEVLADGSVQPRLATWRMWFGRCLLIRDVAL